MLNNFKFANINAKVKGMYSNFLNKNDYEELEKQETIKEALIILKSKLNNIDNIDDNSTREEIERQLYLILVLDIQKIYPLLNKKGKEMLDIYIDKFRLKYTNGSLIKLEYTNEQNEFYRQYFSKLYKKAEKYKDKALIDIIGKQIDLYNILWTFRAKKYYKFEDKQEQNIPIPIHYKLSSEILDKLNNSQLPPEDIISKTIYQEFTLEEEKMETEIQNYLYRLYINYFKTKSFSLTMIISYIELRQIQIKNIITIIEGIRYKVDTNTIQKKLIGE